MGDEYRTHQIKNVYFMETIDDQVDRILELRLFLDYIKKDILNTRAR